MNKTQIRAAAERIAAAIVHACNRTGELPTETELADAAELVLDEAVFSARAESQSPKGYGVATVLSESGIVPHGLKISLGFKPVRPGTLTGRVGTMTVSDSGHGELLVSGTTRLVGRIFYDEGSVVMNDSAKREPYAFDYAYLTP